MRRKIMIAILVLIAVTIAVLLLVRGLSIQYGSNQYHAEQKQVFSGNLINVTGVLFMGPGGDILENRQDEIEYSRSLDFWLYSFNYQPLLELLQNMARAKVKIRAVIENKPFGGDGKSFSKLLKMFTGTRYAEINSDEKLKDNFMHAKTFVTDSGFIIQTANLTFPSFFSNKEFFFISHNPLIRDNLKALFEKDRIGKRITSADIHPNLLICPVDCRYKIETIISGAQHSIRMYQQYIQDEHIMSMLMQRSGLDLKFIVADNDSKEQLMASPLSGFTHFREKPYVHAKMILVDDKYLILSSINMSANSMDNNREIGIVIIDSFLIEQFRGGFERDWKK